jgi:hypothetical protein
MHNQGEDRGWLLLGPCCCRIRPGLDLGRGRLRDLLC